MPTHYHNPEFSWFITINLDRLIIFYPTLLVLCLTKFLEKEDVGVNLPGTRWTRPNPPQRSIKKQEEKDKTKVEGGREVKHAKGDVT